MIKRVVFSTAFIFALFAGQFLLAQESKLEPIKLELPKAMFIGTPRI